MGGQRVGVLGGLVAAVLEIREGFSFGPATNRVNVHTLAHTSPPKYHMQGQHQHESYTGDRTKEAFETFADTLVPSAGQPQVRHKELKMAPQASGCNIAGVVCGVVVAN